LSTHLPTKRYKPKLKVIRVTPTHPRAKARRKLPKPQPRRLPPRRRSQRRLQRKRPVRRPRRSKKRVRALTQVTRAVKEANRTPRTVRSNPPQTLVPMMNKSKENPPRNDHELTVRLFLNS